ncbi:MAG: DoxX family protein [Flavobacteriales bacterium]|nr:DoxX family protein [Flavobacteriales bacterium]
MLIINVLSVALFAALFLQSGIDKLLDWKGNLGWLAGHFEKSFLSGVVPVLLGLVTFTEVLAGLICAYGVVELVVFDQQVYARIGIIFSLVALLMLFIGQRIAQDYPGAAVLANYFLLGIASLYFLV